MGHDFACEPGSLSGWGCVVVMSGQVGCLMGSGSVATAVGASLRRTRWVSPLMGPPLSISFPHSIVEWPFRHEELCASGCRCMPYSITKVSKTTY